MLLSTREVAIRIFGKQTEQEIKLKIRSLSRLASLNKVPFKRIGNDYYFQADWFLQPDNYTMKPEEPALWLRKSL